MELIFNDVKVLLAWLEYEKKSNLNRIKMTASMNKFVPCYKLVYSL